MKNTEKRRLLVTGASGLLGYRVCREAQSRWQVFGIHRTHPVAGHGVEARKIDLTDAGALARAMEEIRPHAVIHTAAVSQPQTCQNDPETARAVNVTATRDLADLCARNGIRMVFTSTDLVFDGLHAPYGENDPVSPVNRYGSQKAEAERCVRETFPKAVICRLPLMFGYAPGTGGGFLGWMIRALARGESIHLFTDEFRTPVDTISAARGLLRFLEMPGETYHLGGRRRLSRYDIGLALLRRGAGNPALLNRASVHDFRGSARRSPDVSLDSARAYCLGYDPEDFDPALDETIRLWRAGPGQRINRR